MTLIARLERPLPAALPAGRSTAVFCTGVCFDTEEAIRGLEILVDGVAYAPAAFGMPRPDLLGTGDGDPRGHGYRSGFWGTVPIRAFQRPGTIELELAVHLQRGVVRCPVGTIEVSEQAPAPTARPPSPGQGLIAVCMATFEPEESLFRAQLDSLRAQTDDRWICLISDDCSSDPHFQQILQLVDADPRFTISRSPTRLGFYRNFERALMMIPPEAELIALCDQDDRWHPDKLDVLRRSLGRATLVYSDQRLVSADGRVLRDTLWEGRRNNYDSLPSILVANTITGAATLFRREIAELTLPFPDNPGFQFHDHWLAAVALAAGQVAYVDRPLYDYVQHRGAVFGDVTHGTRPPGRAEPGGFRARPAERGAWHARLRRGLTRWRAAYFYGYLAREVQAQTLLIRCGDRLSVPKRRALERFVACDSSTPALIWFVARALRCLAGRTETLGSEIELAQGIVWKRLAALAQRWAIRPLAGWRRIPAALADASPPPLDGFSQKRLRRWRARL